MTASFPRPFRLPVLALTAVAALTLTACAAPISETAAGEAASLAVTEITIDTTSLSGATEIAKVGGFFEEQFEPLGITVNYSQLGTSSQMLEGIASGDLDFTDIGYSALPTGGAAGVDFTIIGQASEGGGDIILAPSGGATNISDLVGKTVASSKSSSGWALLVRALETEGLSTDDIELIDLKPDEAQNAFLTNQIDAWATWAGNTTDAITEANNEIIASGEDLGLIPGAIVARGELAAGAPEVVTAFLTARAQALAWLADDEGAVIASIAADRQTDPAIVEKFLGLSVAVNRPIDDVVLADYQATADLFFELGEVDEAADIAALVDSSFFDGVEVVDFAIAQ
jgi:sulfonate transport system substrate-binding protein